MAGKPSGLLLRCGAVSVKCKKENRPGHCLCCLCNHFPHSLLPVQLARRLPARVQGYPWRLAYSTLEHGTSLKTLYRKSASLDNPVLLVIKDMDNQVRSTCSAGVSRKGSILKSDHYEILVTL